MDENSLLLDLLLELLSLIRVHPLFTVLTSLLYSLVLYIYFCLKHKPCFAVINILINYSLTPQRFNIIDCYDILYVSNFAYYSEFLKMKAVLRNT